MVGVDIVNLKRIEDPDRLAEKILSNTELAVYIKRPNKLEYLGGRFAGKEAFFKANKVGLGVIAFKDIDIINEPNGAPILFYKDKKYEISISHDGDYAIAVVVI